MKKVLILMLTMLLAISVVGLVACEDVEVVVNSVSIKNAPTVTSHVGEDFAISDDGKLTVTFSDGTTKEVAITLGD